MTSLFVIFSCFFYYQKIKMEEIQRNRKIKRRACISLRTTTPRDFNHLKRLENMSDSGEGMQQDPEDVLASNPLPKLTQDVLGGILADGSFTSGPQNWLENVDAFMHAITWQDTLIQAIICFQLAMLVVGFVGRKSPTVVFGIMLSSSKFIFCNLCYQSCSKGEWSVSCFVRDMYLTLVYIILLLFYSLVCIVFLAERMNDWGSRNWQQFASQNYFDPNGVFMSLFVAAPLALLSFVLLVRFCCFVSRVRLGGFSGSSIFFFSFPIFLSQCFRISLTLSFEPSRCTRCVKPPLLWSL